MVSSVFYNFYDDADEQALLMDLVAEAIHIYGHDCWYLPRTVHNRDALFTEAEYLSYDSAHMIELYLKTSSQMGGEGALLSKLNVELRDEVVFTVSKKTFQDEVTTENQDLKRPREGDLIFVPMFGAVFTIKYVDKKAFFYQLGDLQAYDLSVELYENSGAIFNTGIPEIDSIYGSDTNLLVGETGGIGASDEILDNFSIRTENGETLLDERDGWILALVDEDKDDMSQNVEFEDAAEEVIDWSESNPFSEGNNY